MYIRAKFVKNRIEYLIKTGMDENEAVNTAKADYSRAAKLADKCVMTCSSRELPGKGETLCNRTACQTDKYVVFYNSVMRKNYCLNCATDIRFCNDLNELDLYPEYNETLDSLFKEIEA